MLIGKDFSRYYPSYSFEIKFDNTNKEYINSNKQNKILIRVKYYMIIIYTTHVHIGLNTMSV